MAAASRRVCALSVALTVTVAQVNYVPDDVSTAPFALALPLLKSGFWVPTVLTVFGIGVSWAGALLWAVGLLATAVVFVAIAGTRPSRSSLLGAGIALALPLIWLVSSTRNDIADQRAVAFLKASWLRH